MRPPTKYSLRVEFTDSKNKLRSRLKIVTRSIYMTNENDVSVSWTTPIEGLVLCGSSVSLGSPVAVCAAVLVALLVTHTQSSFS